MPLKEGEERRDIMLLIATMPPKTGGNNLMSGKGICPNLQKHYDFSAAEKIPFLRTSDGMHLLTRIAEDVAQILVKRFLKGTHGDDSPEWRKVVEYFQANSRIIPALTKNPGTYTMLEKMYHFESVELPIDQYFAMSMAGGQALRNRYDAVNNHMIFHINEVLNERKACLMVDFGSGPGRNGIHACLRNPVYKDYLKIDCIDIDSEALSVGENLAEKHRLSNISFIKKSMTALNGRYEGNIDYGILIGVLCGLTFPERVGLLSKIKPYFRKGARLVAASLLEEMAVKDLFCAYILRETTGWGLQYPPLGELKKAFESAGWQYEGYFQDEPTRFYEIGVGIA